MSETVWRNNTLGYYERAAAPLASRYESAEVDNLQRLLCESFQAPSLLLDAGCGSGRDAAFMRQQGHSVIPLDGSIQMLKQALGLHPELAGNVVCCILPGPLPFRTGSFDGAFSIGTLMHLREDSLIVGLSEIGRVLRSGGMFQFSVSLERNDVDASGTDLQGRFFLSLPASQWSSLCRAAGFSVSRSEVLSDGLGRQGISWLNIVATKHG